MYSLPNLVAVYGNLRSKTRSLQAPVIEQARFIAGNMEILVPLGIKGLAIIDVLVRYKPNLLSAAQIERIVRTDPICARLGIERLMSRRIIKVYIHRVRKQLARALHNAGVVIEPKRLLVSENTEVANVTAYRLAIPCKIVRRDFNPRS